MRRSVPLVLCCLASAALVRGATPEEAFAAPPSEAHAGVTVAHIPTGSYVQPTDRDSAGLEGGGISE